MTEDQLAAVVDLALDLRLPWQRRALLGPLPAAADDQAERAALLSGLDRLAASPAQASPDLNSRALSWIAAPAVQAVQAEVEEQTRAA